MKTLLSSSIVLLTILFSFAFGIALGYAVIIAILRTFAYKPRQEQAAAASHTVVAASASQ
jgi:Na+/melibiose symporter-like transporter